MDVNAKPRVLILAGRTTGRADLMNLLSAQYQVDQFDTLDAAMAALRDQPYDAVFADVGDFLPLERSLVSQQSMHVLNTIGEGVMVVDEHNLCCWSNKRMRSFSAEVIEKAKNICIRARAMFGAQMRAGGDPLRNQSKKFTFQEGDDRYYELICSPVLDEGDHVRQVVAVVWDASRGKRLEQKINAIDSAGRELAKLDAERIARLSPSQRLELLRDKIIKFCKELMSFDHFAIRVVDKRNNKLELVIAEGLPPAAMDVDLYAQPEGNGISGYVAATGRSYICHDTEKDPRYIMGIEHAKSSLTVPLRLHDSVIGIFNIESRAVGAFDEDDRQFAEIFGQYIAIALNALNLMVVERCNTNQQVAASVLQELAQPLNDIITDARTLAEEYVGEDTMRHRLNKIIENVQQLRENVKSVAEGTRTVLGKEAAKNAVRDPLLAGKRVLIADDEVNIRTTIGEVLTKYGCVCTICKDGYEACHLLEQQSFDLVLSDIRMPQRNGYEIFAAARRRSDHLPVILMTGFGYDPHHSIVRASQEGLAAVMFKPFKVEQMLEEVRKALKVQTAGEPAPQPDAPAATPPTANNN